MHSFAFSNPTYLALLQVPGVVTPPPPPPVLVWTYADNSRGGLETNIGYLPQVGVRNAHNNDLYDGSGAGLFMSMAIETTQFKLLACRQPSGSDFELLLRDGQGAVLLRSTQTCYAASQTDSAEIWVGPELPKDVYTLEINSLNTGDGRLVLDAIAYQGTAQPLPYVKPSDPGTRHNLNAAGNSSWRVKDGTFFYGFETGYCEYTSQVPVTRLLVRAPKQNAGGDATVTITDASGNVVLTGEANNYQNPDGVSVVVYDSGPLPAGFYTIRYANKVDSRALLLVDCFFYQAA